jgi:hypothetical protein
MDRPAALAVSLEVLQTLAHNSINVDEENGEDGAGDAAAVMQRHDNYKDNVGVDNTKGPPHETEKKRYTIQEQRAVIRKINESNQILKQELSIEWREAKTMMGTDKQSKLIRLQKQSTAYSHKIEQEKRSIQKMEELIALRQRELQQLREDNVKNEKLESTAAATRRVRALEVGQNAMVPLLSKIYNLSSVSMMVCSRIVLKFLSSRKTKSSPSTSIFASRSKKSGGIVLSLTVFTKNLRGNDTNTGFVSTLRRLNWRKLWPQKTRLTKKFRIYSPSLTRSSNPTRKNSKSCG